MRKSSVLSLRKKMVLGLVVMALLSPLGLVIPEFLRAGAAWGEWDLSEVTQMVGYSPAGMEKTMGRWNAPLPDYALPGEQRAGIAMQSVIYAVSGVAGALLCGAVGLLLARRLSSRKGK